MLIGKIYKHYFTKKISNCSNGREICFVKNTGIHRKTKATQLQLIVKYECSVDIAMCFSLYNDKAH